MFGGGGRDRRYIYTLNGQQFIGDRDDLHTRNLNQEKLLSSNNSMSVYPAAVKPMPEMSSEAPVEIIGTAESFAVDCSNDKLDH